MHSILEILLINVKEGTYKSGARVGQTWQIKEAHCVLRKEDGSAGAVGVLTVPKSLDEVAKVGVFTAGFSLTAPTYGENQGKIVAELQSLTPVQPNAFRKGSALNPAAGA